MCILQPNAYQKSHYQNWFYIFFFIKKNRRFVRWKRRSVLFLFQIFTELIGFFKGFGVSRRFAGAVQTAYEQ